MYKIAILLKDRARDGRVEKAIQENLECVFGDIVRAEGVFLREVDDTSLDSYDLILVMVFHYVQELYSILEHYPKREKLLYVSRTLSPEAVERVRAIPKGTRVLVVNQSEYTSFELLRLLYQLDITHLNLVPWNEKRDLTGFTYIIKAGTVTLHQPEEAEVIDVGVRKLDTYAFLDIISHLGIRDSAISQNLKQYAQTLSDKHTDVEKWYLSSIVNSQILENVMQKTDFGVLVVREDGMVDYCNEKAKEIFKNAIQENKLLPKEQEYTRKWMEPDFQRGLVKVDREFVMVERVPLSESGPGFGYYFECQTAQDINRSGSRLSRELQKSGMFAKYTFQDIIYYSPQMRKCIDVASQLAKTEYTILIFGESGSGKELFAQSIHNASTYRNGPFVAINCAAFPESLLESELFGYVSGAFTGSNRSGKTGLFELANKGTIFLDEIGEMPYSLQAKLLRVLQEKRIMRIGDDRYTDIDVRVLSATNKNLRQEIQKGTFREDLYYRLSALSLTIPPLRERKEDILPLFQIFCDKNVRKLSSREEKLLQTYGWPGNVRELQNVAAYYNVIGQLNLQEQSYDGREEKPLEEVLLHLLREHSGEGLGRGRIIALLNERRIKVTQKQVEMALQVLLEQGIITRGRGRQAVRIKQKTKE